MNYDTGIEIVSKTGGGPQDYLCSQARVDGCRSALEQAGIVFDPGLVRHGDFQHEGGFRRGGELLDLAEPPTAIFTGSDQQALGVCRLS